MREERIFWSGYCSKNRMEAVGEIEKIIADYGFLIDFTRFSDMAMSLIVELEERNIDAFYEKLKSYLSLNEFALLNSQSKKERHILIHVSFTKSTGDLEIEIPQIPG